MPISNSNPRNSLATALATFGPYELYMLSLSVFSIGVLAADTLLPLPDAIKDVLEYTDTALCLLFFADFIRSVVKAPDRMRYLVRAGWLDFASSIPAIDALRLGRLSRIARIVRLLRAMRSARTIDTIVSHHRKESALLATGTVSILLVVFGSIAILQFETSPEANITTGGDALWWAFATITTVGYGDHYPVTLAGRLVASVLMAAGLGLFGTVSGLAASWFLNASNDSEASQISALAKEVTQLRTMLEATLPTRRSEF